MSYPGWGDSLGGEWGNSWGAIVPTPVVIPPLGYLGDDVVSRKRKPKQPLPQKKQRKKDDAEAIALAWMLLEDR